MRNMRKRASDVREPFQFGWEVPEGGYRYERGSAENAEFGTELMLIESTPVGVSRMVKRHRTLKESTGLFIEFAHVDATPAGIIAFANQYGPLGGTLTQLVTVGKRNAKEKPVYAGESIAAWLREIAAVRRLLQLWLQDIKAEITFRTAAESIFAEWASGSSVVAFRATDPDTYERLKNKTAEIALHYLRAQVNAKLIEHPATARLIYEKSRGAFGLFIVPSSLIAAIWLQFAAAIDGNRRYRSCKNCGKWFEVGGSGRRAHTEACSDSCRAAFAYRKGKK
jgi:hypothetical protein